MKFEDVADEILVHYGVKGMRWGQRKKRSGSDSERTRFQQGPKHLTMDELENRIKRMEMEKNYNRLNSRTVSVGERIASEIMQNSGRTVATTVLTGATLFGIKKAIEKKLGPIAAAAITKRGK